MQWPALAQKATSLLLVLMNDFWHDCRQEGCQLLFEPHPPLGLMLSRFWHETCSAGNGWAALAFV